MDILKISEKEEDVLLPGEEEEPLMLEEEEIDLSKEDLTVPEGIGTDDPVRMYLKEIGKIPFSPRGGD